MNEPPELCSVYDGTLYIRSASLSPVPFCCAHRSQRQDPQYCAGLQGWNIDLVLCSGNAQSMKRDVY